MIEVLCEACGKRYRVDETRMKGDVARVACKACGKMLTVRKPRPAEEAPPPPPPPPAEAVAEVGTESPGAGSEPEAAAAAWEEPFSESAYPRTRPRFGIFGKTLAFMLVVGIVPLVLFWFVTFRESSARMRADAEAILVEAGKGLSDRLDAWTQSNFAVLRMAAAMPEIRSMNRERQEPLLRAIAREYPWMYLVFTVGPDGMNVGRSDREPLVSYADRQYVKDALAGRQMAWQTVIGRTSNVPALVIAVPVREGERVTGVMAAAITVEEISRHITAWKRGGTGSAFLLDEQGFVIAHPARHRVQRRENLESHPLIAEFRKKGWTTLTASFTDETGRPQLGHARKTGLGWVLALAQEEAEVFEALSLLRHFAYALLAITALLAAVVAWFAARGLIRPILQLTQAAERMSLGDLDVKIDVRSADEIGILALAIERLQTSLALAIQRLKKKR
ncbi:MAG: cache domain-containing protein [Desulfobacterales bacterium]